MNTLAFLQKKRERHGDVFALHSAGGQDLLMVADPALVKPIFNAPSDVLAAGEANRRILAEAFGDQSLILLDGERHLGHRRIILPHLHGARLERHAETMRALAEEQLERWPIGEEVATLPLLRALVLDVVLRIVVGAGDQRRDALRRELYELFLPEPLSASAVRRAKKLIATEVAAYRKVSPAPGSDDVLSLLLDARLEDGSPLSDAEVRDETTALLMTATGTTSGSLAWVLECLTRNPPVLVRATEEARAGGGPFLEAIINETLRVRPAVPALARLVKRDFQLGDRPIPPRTVIAVSILLVHHHPDIYEEPMAFRSERFLERKPGTYTWIPFGGGVRRCVGASFALLEMRIVLTSLLERVTPRAPGAAPETAENRLNTMVPAEGARLVFDVA